ncbi:uncharacterized protein MONOS_465 [Monocercomonoides exilis]|uniref:uncharacterized protein n=1 Tax=Monocercomonoides exilis TaxID=2049356 RepID=UPI00355A3D59|nr:hypothetical protein MONOS_465 [Monocercomonoides exilis]|eukprot:MONOS_465.1-p1 / transcript=MONOS_465.1 / gene=MONOS_465 / organism=Monocercomonoides_exilis_PA203 / gene_product=unspecified product / transcript_product=unspecified product / location=Mono_scaffold00007:192157-200787(+) / protein_length=2877 / sequence_SO=supercontig / SO=protein_coding / is_pseudo=false
MMSGNGNGSLTLTSCTFDRCSSDRNGGGLYAVGLEHVSIKFTSFNECVTGSTSTGALGGGCYISQISNEVELKACKFSGCTADSKAGGMFLSSIPNELMPVEECEYRNCIAVEMTGGGISMMEFNPEMSMSNCLFDSCSSKFGGGGLDITFKVSTTINKEERVKRKSFNILHNYNNMTYFIFFSFANDTTSNNGKDVIIFDRQNSLSQTPFDSSFSTSGVDRLCYVNSKSTTIIDSWLPEGMLERVVSPKTGQNTDDCGSQHEPCLTIEWAIQRMNSIGTQRIRVEDGTCNEKCINIREKSAIIVSSSSETVLCDSLISTGSLFIVTTGDLKIRFFNIVHGKQINDIDHNGLLHLNTPDIVEFDVTLFEMTGSGSISLGSCNISPYSASYNAIFTRPLFILNGGLLEFDDVSIISFQITCSMIVFSAGSFTPSSLLLTKASFTNITLSENHASVLESSLPSTTSFIIDNCTFSSCTSKNCERGGGIFISLSNMQSLYISDSGFTMCESASGNTQSCCVFHSEQNNEEVTGRGGGLFISVSDITKPEIKNSNFDPLNFQLTNLVFKENYASIGRDLFLQCPRLIELVTPENFAFSLDPPLFNRENAIFGSETTLSSFMASSLSHPLTDFNLLNFLINFKDVQISISSSTGMDFLSCGTESLPCKTVEVGREHLLKDEEGMQHLQIIDLGAILKVDDFTDMSITGLKKSENDVDNLSSSLSFDILSADNQSCVMQNLGRLSFSSIILNLQSNLPPQITHLIYSEGCLEFNVVSFSCSSSLSVKCNTLSIGSGSLICSSATLNPVIFEKPFAIATTFTDISITHFKALRPSLIGCSLIMISPSISITSSKYRNSNRFIQINDSSFENVQHSLNGSCILSFSSHSNEGYLANKNEDSFPTVYISNSKFSNCLSRASSQGGALFVQLDPHQDSQKLQFSPQLHIKDSIFSSCEASTASDPEVVDIGRGGALYLMLKEGSTKLQANTGNENMNCADFFFENIVFTKNNATIGRDLFINTVDLLRDIYPDRFILDYSVSSFNQKNAFAGSDDEIADLDLLRLLITFSNSTICVSSTSGLDVLRCGSQAEPCKSIPFAATHISETIVDKTLSFLGETIVETSFDCTNFSFIGSGDTFPVTLRFSRNILNENSLSVLRNTEKFSSSQIMFSFPSSLSSSFASLIASEYSAKLMLTSCAFSSFTEKVETEAEGYSFDIIQVKGGSLEMQSCSMQSITFMNSFIHAQNFASITINRMIAIDVAFIDGSLINVDAIANSNYESEVSRRSIQIEESNFSDISHRPSTSAIISLPSFDNAYPVDISVENSSISECICTECIAGGCIAMIVDSTSSFTTTNCSFTESLALKAKGGIAYLNCINATNDFAFNKVIFERNDAAEGRNIFIESDNLHLSIKSFRFNFDYLSDSVNRENSMMGIDPSLKSSINLLRYLIDYLEKTVYVSETEGIDVNRCGSEQEPCATMGQGLVNLIRDSGKAKDQSLVLVTNVTMISGLYMSNVHLTSQTEPSMPRSTITLSKDLFASSKILVNREDFILSKVNFDFSHVVIAEQAVFIYSTPLKATTSCSLTLSHCQFSSHNTLNENSFLPLSLIEVSLSTIEINDVTFSSIQIEFPIFKLNHMITINVNNSAFSKIELNQSAIAECIQYSASNSSSLQLTTVSFSQINRHTNGPSVVMYATEFPLEIVTETDSEIRFEACSFDNCRSSSSEAGGALYIDTRNGGACVLESITSESCEALQNELNPVEPQKGRGGFLYLLTSTIPELTSYNYLFREMKFTNNLANVGRDFFIKSVDLFNTINPLLFLFDYQSELFNKTNALYGSDDKGNVDVDLLQFLIIYTNETIHISQSQGTDYPSCGTIEKLCKTIEIGMEHLSSKEETQQRTLSFAPDCLMINSVDWSDLRITHTDSFPSESGRAELSFLSSITVEQGNSIIKNNGNLIFEQVNFILEKSFDTSVHFLISSEYNFEKRMRNGQTHPLLKIVECNFIFTQEPEKLNEQSLSYSLVSILGGSITLDKCEIAHLSFASSPLCFNDHANAQLNWINGTNLSVEHGPLFSVYASEDDESVDQGAIHISSSFIDSAKILDTSSALLNINHSTSLNEHASYTICLETTTFSFISSSKSVFGGVIAQNLLDVEDKLNVTDCIFQECVCGCDVLNESVTRGGAIFFSCESFCDKFIFSEIDFISDNATIGRDIFMVCDSLRTYATKEHFQLDFAKPITEFNPENALYGTDRIEFTDYDLLSFLIIYTSPNIYVSSTGSANYSRCGSIKEPCTSMTIGVAHLIDREDEAKPYELKTLTLMDYDTINKSVIITNTTIISAIEMSELCSINVGYPFSMTSDAHSVFTSSHSCLLQDVRIGLPSIAIDECTSLFMSVPTSEEGECRFEGVNIEGNEFEAMQFSFLSVNGGSVLISNCSLVNAIIRPTMITCTTDQSINVTAFDIDEMKLVEGSLFSFSNKARLVSFAECTFQKITALSENSRLISVTPEDNINTNYDEHIFEIKHCETFGCSSVLKNGNLITANGVSAVMEYCLFDGYIEDEKNRGRRYNNKESLNGICSWDESSISFISSNVLISNASFTNLLNGALSFEHSVVTLKDISLENNTGSVIDESYPSIRRNVICSNDGFIDFESIKEGDGIQGTSLWISNNNCSIGGKALTDVSSYHFVPILSKVEKGTSSDKKTPITFEGSLLLPCNLSFEVLIVKKSIEEHFSFGEIDEFVNENQMEASIPTEYLDKHALEMRIRLVFGGTEAETSHTTQSVMLKPKTALSKQATTILTISFIISWFLFIFIIVIVAMIKEKVCDNCKCKRKHKFIRIDNEDSLYFRDTRLTEMTEEPSKIENAVNKEESTKEESISSQPLIPLVVESGKC